MRLAALTLVLLCIAVKAHALEPASAIAAALPDAAVAESREAADYAIAVQTQTWVAGPSFVTGKSEWYLYGKITATVIDKVSTPEHTAPFAPGQDILVNLHCAQGAGCAAFENRKILIWALMADTHARQNKNHLLIQIDNPLDVAFTP